MFEKKIDVPVLDYIKLRNFTCLTKFIIGHPRPPHCKLVRLLLLQQSPFCIWKCRLCRLRKCLACFKVVQRNTFLWQICFGKCRRMNRGNIHIYPAKMLSSCLGVAGFPAHQCASSWVAWFAHNIPWFNLDIATVVILCLYVEIWLKYS